MLDCESIMPFFLYILKCYSTRNKISFYLGYTNNLERRFNEHLSGKSRYTKQFKQIIPILIKSFISEKEARREEWELKHDRKKEKSRIIECPEKFNWLHFDEYNKNLNKS